jgi:DinB superfamily
MDSRLEELKEAVESAVEGMTSEQMNWRPATKWCAAEVLEHLYLTYSGTIKGFSKVMQSGRPLGTRASVVQRVRKLVVVGFNHMPTGRKAPATTQPRGLPTEQVRAEVGAKIVEMDAIIAQCEARFGRGSHLLDHPVLGPLTARQWRKFHLVHGRHHVKQLLRIRDARKRDQSSSV